MSLKNDLSAGLTPGPGLTPVTRRLNLVVICSYLALCIVNRSTPFPSTGSEETRDITLNDMDTGFLLRHVILSLGDLCHLKQAKSVDLHRVLVRLHLLLCLLSSLYPLGHYKDINDPRPLPGAWPHLHVHTLVAAPGVVTLGPGLGTRRPRLVLTLVNVLKAGMNILLFCGLNRKCCKMANRACSADFEDG